VTTNRWITDHLLLLLYYITDRTQFPGGKQDRRQQLLDKIGEAALGGVDFVQLREKDLSGRELELLARDVINRIHQSHSSTHLLINSRTDVAVAVGADGVHLRSIDISPGDVRKIWREAGGPGKPVIALSCHSDAEVAAAEKAGADFVVFGPVFNKKSPEARAAGVDLLRSVSRRKVPVFAVGGVTPENAGLCVETGAKGVAGIRLFQKNNISSVLAKLRSYRMQ
jgi:thiamine-phosphate pyrophosphorylase